MWRIERRLSSVLWEVKFSRARLRARRNQAGNTRPRLIKLRRNGDVFTPENYSVSFGEDRRSPLNAVVSREREARQRAARGCNCRLNRGSSLRARLENRGSDVSSRVSQMFARRWLRGIIKRANRVLKLLLRWMRRTAFLDLDTAEMIRAGAFNRGC